MVYLAIERPVFSTTCFDFFNFTVDYIDTLMTHNKACEEVFLNNDDSQFFKGKFALFFDVAGSFKVTEFNDLFEVITVIVELTIKF